MLRKDEGPDFIALHALDAVIPNVVVMVAGSGTTEVFKEFQNCVLCDSGHATGSVNGVPATKTATRVARLSPKNPGNWRPGTVYVRDESKNEVVYEGPDIEMVPGLIDELIEYLNNEDECPHALIKGAMAHLNLVMIHPFSDGNGRMARCLQTLVLAREGILESEFSSIEEYLGRNTQEYYNVLARTGAGSWHPKNSTREWMQFNLTAHFRQATTLLMRTKVMDMLWQELEQMVARHGLPSRLLYAVTDGAIGYRVRNCSYRNLAELSDVMASRDLKAAVDAGLLIPTGERRGRVYVGSPETKALFDKLRRDHIKAIPDPFVPMTPQLRFES